MNLRLWMREGMKMFSSAPGKIMGSGAHSYFDDAYGAAYVKDHRGVIRRKRPKVRGKAVRKAEKRQRRIDRERLEAIKAQQEAAA